GGGEKGSPAPAGGAECERDHLREQPADRHAGRADAESQRPAAAEPGDDRDRDRQVPPEARAERHHEERDEKRGRRSDLAEQDEGEPEDGHADPDQRAGSEPVGEPPRAIENAAENSVLLQPNSWRSRTTNAPHP